MIVLNKLERYISNDIVSQLLKLKIVLMKIILFIIFSRIIQFEPTILNIELVNIKQMISTEFIKILIMSLLKYNEIS